MVLGRSEARSSSAGWLYLLLLYDRRAFMHHIILLLACVVVGSGSGTAVGCSLVASTVRWVL